ncbi:MAG: UvrD-helicase domain-containing protein, partial [Mycoplasmataceae bacterium]|nr:UvrD-helicase domain-containing protein [Mycoplasmataceae bacterium]
MKIIKETLIYDSEAAFRDIYAMHEILDVLKDVILSFDEEFMQKKIERHIIDFNDIEHYALKILVKKDEKGNYVGTDVAKKYREKFEEIAIDEYQDSNQVQEYILSTVSRGNNLFMVGDVKQSIYKFRQACPELFLDKYDRYDLNGNDDGLKIQLFKNFRSRENVLQITNEVFKTIMSKDLGDIDYTQEEYLNLGANFEPHENSLDIAELDIIDLKDDDSVMAWKNNAENQNNENIETKENTNVKKYEFENDEDLDEFINQLEKEQIEAKFVVKRIKEIIDSNVQVKDKKLGYRDVTYKDIVILLRSTSKLAPIYEKELINSDIPVFSDSSNEYLDTIEIQTIIGLLKILDNPIDDISLVSVLRSEIGGFDDNEIVEVRLCKRDGSFYDSLLIAREEAEDELKEKVSKFLDNLNTWRKESEYLSLAELIWKIYTDTGFYNYVGLMPNGLLRQANLKMLFERAKEYEKTSFKGLFNFIMFVERLKTGNSDMSSAKIIGENENVVRIMSIHKSKGLEFPIVFLCSTSKKINMQDLNSNLLLHQKLGIGPQYINYEKMIEYSTSAKDAIKIVTKEEAISEEMRILYVALTRAKEKLIITGTSKDHLKDLEKKKEILKVYNSKNGKLNPIILKKYISYLDWIELVLLNSEEMKSLINVNKYSKKDIFTNEEEKEVLIKEEFDFDKEIDFEKYQNEFLWDYKHKIATKLPIKSTVSKIKEMQNDGIDFLELTSKDIGIAEIVPNFMESEERISASRKGTLMHLFLQKLDLKKTYSSEELENLRQELIAKNIILKEEADSINLTKIKNFLNSS